MMLSELHEMNNDWDFDTIFKIHTFEDWTGNHVVYRGSWADMPMKYGRFEVRAFGTEGMAIYIELKKGEEENL